GELVTLRIEAAIGLEGRDRLDLLAHARVADLDARRARSQAQHRLVDDGVEHLALVVDAFEGAGIERLALRLALALALGLELAAEGFGIDFLGLPGQLA